MTAADTLGAEDVNWRRLLRTAALAWLAVAGLFILLGRRAIAVLDFPDTDDAQRLAQVRDWLGGQPWGDLTQHRMYPPVGAASHWSRVVDLPLGALIRALDPFVGAVAAERIAIVAAPLLMLAILLPMVGLAAGRLTPTAPQRASTLAMIFTLAAWPTYQYFRPLRIDHHAAQLAAIAVMLAMLCDPLRRRWSGVVAGLTLAVSFAIGLELLHQYAVVMLVVALAWCLDSTWNRMSAAFFFSLAGGLVVVSALFVPTVRWGRLACDAMSPTYLAALVPVCIALGLLPSVKRLRSAGFRIAATTMTFGLGGMIVASIDPRCLRGPIASISPDVMEITERIGEGKSIVALFSEARASVVFFAAAPTIALVCAFLLARRARGAARWPWYLVSGSLAVGLVAGLLFVRALASPALLGSIAAASAAAEWTGRFRLSRTGWRQLVRVLALQLALSAASGYAAAIAVAVATGSEQRAPGVLEVCDRRESFAPLKALPVGVIMNVVDMGPALLVHTDHSVLSGPYHRTERMLPDGLRFWRARDSEAREMARAHGGAYVLACGAAADLRAALREAPDGLWGQLHAGHVPSWLEPIELPSGSPLQLYRIVDL